MLLISLTITKERNTGTMTENLRYSRCADFIELLSILQKPLGVTIKEVQEHFNISRRTAERMLESIMSVLPQVDEIEVTTDLYKHWGFTEYTFKRIVVFNRRIRKTITTMQ